MHFVIVKTQPSSLFLAETLQAGKKEDLFRELKSFVHLLVPKLEKIGVFTVTYTKFSLNFLLNFLDFLSTTRHIFKASLFRKTRLTDNFFVIDFFFQLNVV